MSRVECDNCGRPSQDDRPICHRCTQSLVNDLRKVPELVAEMLTTRTRLDRVTPPATAGRSSDEPLPIRPGAMKVYHELNNCLTTWARDIAETHNVCISVRYAATVARAAIMDSQRMRTVDLARLVDCTVTSAEIAAVWLAAHHQWLRECEGLAEMFETIGGKSGHLAAARRTIDRLPERAYKGRCEYSTTEAGVTRKCNEDLYVDKGEDWAKCPACGSVYEVEKLDKAILAQMENMNYTIGEIRTILDSLGHRVPKSTMYAWARNRKILAPRAWRRSNGQITDFWFHRNDQAMYRLGDVLTLAGAQIRSDA